MHFKLILSCLLIQICNSQTDNSKWTWGSSRSRSDNFRAINGEKRYNGALVGASKGLFQANSNYNGVRESANLLYRYEVTEDPSTSDYTTYRPLPTQQYRPDPNRPNPNRPVNPYRPPPDFVRPTNTLVNNYRPTNRPFENTYNPQGSGFRPPTGGYAIQNLRPGIGTNGKPILTGPVPSWVGEENPYKYKDYDVCKCVHSFNCNTPGIKFGTCDVDKQYCCFKTKPGDRYDGFEKPITNIYERPRPVLAGPGGPVDFPGKQYQNHRQNRRPFITNNADRDLDEAYKKGLASTLYKHEIRPDFYGDRDRQVTREQYPYDGNSYTGIDNFKSSHPLKYGLYDPLTNAYARSLNSTISAIGDQKD